MDLLHVPEEGAEAGQDAELCGGVEDAVPGERPAHQGGCGGHVRQVDAEPAIHALHAVQHEKVFGRRGERIESRDDDPTPLPPEDGREGGLLTGDAQATVLDIERCAASLYLVADTPRDPAPPMAGPPRGPKPLKDDGIDASGRRHDQQVQVVAQVGVVLEHLGKQGGDAARVARLRDATGELERLTHPLPLPLHGRRDERRRWLAERGEPLDRADERAAPLGDLQQRRPIEGGHRGARWRIFQQEADHQGGVGGLAREGHVAPIRSITRPWSVALALWRSAFDSVTAVRTHGRTRWYAVHRVRW